MINTISRRLAKLEHEMKGGSSFIMWMDSNDLDAVPEPVELCGLTHEECLDLLDAEEDLK